MKFTTDLETGELVSCYDCGQEYEVTKEKPLALDLAPMEECDWGQ